MNKQELIRKAVEIIKERKPDFWNFVRMITFKEGELGEDAYSFHPFFDFVDFFEEFDNVENVYVHGTILDNITEKIFSGLTKFKNLKSLYFNDIPFKGEAHIYLEECIKNLHKFDSLELINTQLENFPKLPFEKLKELNIHGNNFYKQNFYFASNENRIDQNEILESLSEFWGSEHKLYNWGLFDEANSIIITREVRNDLNSKMYAYVFNESNLSNYESFQKCYTIFEKANNKLKCFQVNKKQKLEVVFHKKNKYNHEYFFYTILRDLLKKGEIKVSDEFVSDLLIELGGVELLQEIDIENKKTQKKIAKKFNAENNFITKIEIENFKLFDKVNLDGLGNINIIVGKNAAGKTSLLQAVATGLAFEQLKLVAPLSDYINKKIDAKLDSLRYSRIHLKWQNFEKAKRIFESSIIPEKIENFEKELPENYFVLAYGENLYSKNSLYKEELDVQDVLVEGNYKSKHVKSLFVGAYENMPNPAKILYEISAGLRVEYSKEPAITELSNIEKLICKKLNDFLKASPAKQFVFKLDGAHYKFYDKENNLFINFSQISEGYRSYITLLTDIIFRILAARKRLMTEDYPLKDIFKNVRGAIIIDEFDKHMHPSWQRTFLGTLKEEFPNIQFFLSTHNVVAMQSAEGERVFVLEDEKIRSEEIPVGYSLEALYELYFNENFYSEKITEKLTEFKSWRNKIFKTKDFTLLENVDFKKIADELCQINSQLAGIVDKELYQLNKHKKNAQAK